MLMSKSRLEKFLYALYSLDSRDLPNPLSRIEELYKCWVTGEEVPTFEPISRTEKYLMAILGVYDVDSLPNPLSRVEVLLYKLATGDDNLDDVKSFLSEHEELLAEIIRNGGVGGNIDIEYVLHTLSTGYNILYNTAEKPVKSAILMGQTLINLWNNSGQHSIAATGWIDQEGNCFKKSTKYLLKYNVLQTNTNNSLIVQYYKNGSWVSNKQVYTDLNKDYDILTMPSVDFDKIRIFYNSAFGTETVILEDIMLLEYQDGMENWDIPYFEGMQSVKMPVLTTTGKNLFDEINGSFKKKNSVSGTNGEITYYPNHVGVFENYIPVKPNTTYTLSGQLIDGGNNPVFRVAFYQKDKAFNKTKNQYVANNGGGNHTSYTFTTSENEHYIRFSFGAMTQGYFQLEEGTIVTKYEPFKSNILTVNEDVTLRSNGDVYDELDLLTGRLTQRNDENNEVLAQEVVKTVDLSVVNQDGNDTKLSTFDDITHVILSSEGLIPEAELEVATKNGEVLSTLSLEMDDISTSQNTLEETANTQSENVDATMIAATEIYEGLL